MENSKECDGEACTPGSFLKTTCGSSGKQSLQRLNRGTK